VDRRYTDSAQSLKMAYIYKILGTGRGRKAFELQEVFKK